jgi:hypothetical protein
MIQKPPMIQQIRRCVRLRAASSVRTGMRVTRLAISALWIASAACAAASPEPPGPLAPLELELAGHALHGSFRGAEVPIAFSATLMTPDRASLVLTLPQLTLDVELDRAARTLIEDPHGDMLGKADQAAMIALSDVLEAEHPELHDHLHGALLVRMLDRFAEAPTGLALERHETSYTPRAPAPSLVAGCFDDGVQCLPGTRGTTWAVYDDAAGSCTWQPTSYGGTGCPGRCGAGCNWFDNDYTWDCLDHDRCVGAYGGSVLSDNPHCGDEFWEAADDYIATMGALCFGGSTRTNPLM